MKPEEKVLDVRRLDFSQQIQTKPRGRPAAAAAAGREAPRGQPVGDEALWGGAFRERPAWLPLPGGALDFRV